jgi:predicted ATPase/DNA-binding SARP family transcriptional activator
MEIRILGPLEVSEDGKSLPLGGVKQRAVLVLLALEAGRVVSRGALVDGLWQDDPPATATNILQVYVSQLRKTLGSGRIGTVGAGYVLSEVDLRVDCDHFSALMAEGTRHLERGDAHVAGQTLRAALGLWRGPALSDIVDFPFAQAEAVRLEELRLAAIELRIEADLAMGCHQELVGELETLVTRLPLRERLWAQLMRALYRCGRQADALAAFQRARDKLVDDLGIEPGALLRQMESAVLAQEPYLDAPVHLPPAVSRHNLPAPLTSFVGREADLQEVRRMLSTARLVTLTGSAGVGKTRLALEVAADLADCYRDGVWLVELASLSEEKLIAQQVASALGLREEARRTFPDIIIDYARSKQLLLIVDNCEHLLEGAAHITHVLLKGCPNLSILATSRQTLGVPGEQAWRVPSLPLPDPGETPTLAEATRYDAVRLLLNRASLANQEFRFGADNFDAILEISRSLDGIPLAIELAAARVKVLSAAEIAARLSDRFGLLTGGSRTVLPRQRTLRALVDWSYDLLTDQEQALLTRLSVFSDGFTLEAAENVCIGGLIQGDFVLDILTQLVDKSLVLAHLKEEGTRYGLLETIRQYGAERLMDSGEQERFKKRYRHWYVQLGEHAEPNLETADQVAWLNILQAEHGNLREALKGCRETGEFEAAYRLAAAIWRFWWIRGYLGEGRAWLGGAFSDPGVDPAVQAKALHAAGALAWDQGDFRAAQDFLSESMSLYAELGDNRKVALSLFKLGAVFGLQGDNDKARTLLQESLTLGKQLNDAQAVANSFLQLAHVAMQEGKMSEVRSLCDKSLAWFRGLGDIRGIVASLGLLGEVALDRGDHTAARAMLQENLDMARTMGDKWRVARMQTMLGELARAQNDYRRAIELHKNAMILRREIGQRDGIVESIEAIALILTDKHDYCRAVMLYGVADGFREAGGAPVHPSKRKEHMDRVALARSAMDGTDFVSAWQAGRLMPPEEALQFALENCEGVELCSH